MEHGKGACAPASKKRVLFKDSLSWNALTGDTGGKGEVFTGKRCKEYPSPHPYENNSIVELFRGG